MSMITSKSIGKLIGTRAAHVRFTITTVAILFLWVAAAPLVHAHSDNELEIPLSDAPVIDGVVEADEWSEAVFVTVSLQNSDADIYFMHDRENLYVGFDIHDGHNSVFPDTRVYLDTDHDLADTPQEDDFQLYINPDNGGLRERQGDGNGWEDVDVVDWDGDWDEDDTEHWSTEYEIMDVKMGDRVGNDTIGLAILVYGNTQGDFVVWPDDADVDNPSTWGDMVFDNWTVPPDDNGNGTNGTGEEPPPGNNNTDPGNDTGDDDDDDLLSGFDVIAVAAGGGSAAVAVAVATRGRKRKREIP